MFAVIQFSENDGGTVSAVNKDWLTPRRCEVYWPPAKGSKAFDRFLSHQASPDEKWKLYGVQRVFNETGFQDKVISLLSHLKNQNEQMLAMLKGTLETAELDTDFDLPIKSEEEVRTTEDLLKRDDKYANLIKYLKSFGGRNLSNKVSRVMKILLLDSVAAHYSFYGKRSNKKAFSELRLEKCVVDAVYQFHTGNNCKTCRRSDQGVVKACTG